MKRGALVSWTAPTFTIAVASQLSRVHPQTIRLYERHGLVSPRRTSGIRLYSARDIERIHAVDELVRTTKVNLAGAGLVLELQDALTQASARLARLSLPPEETGDLALPPPRRSPPNLQRKLRAALRNAKPPSGLPAAQTAR